MTMHTRLAGYGRMAAGIITERERYLVCPNPRVDRDPCQRCNIRRDIGCDCPQGALGTRFG